MRKAQREFRRALERCGISIEEMVATKNHLKVVVRKKKKRATLYMSKTASCHHALANAVGDAKRLLR